MRIITKNKMSSKYKRVKKIKKSYMIQLIQV
jgi:hypothetical protein